MVGDQRLQPRPQSAVEVARSPGVTACAHGVILQEASARPI